MSLLLYGLAAAGLTKESRHLRCRVLQCAACYSLGVLGTFGLDAILHPSYSPGWFADPPVLDALSQILLSLNGAAIAFSYARFTWSVLGRNNHARFAPEAASDVTLSQSARPMTAVGYNSSEIGCDETPSSSSGFCPSLTDHFTISFRAP